MFNSYVNNVFLTAPDVGNLVQGITEIEMVEAKGGFTFKEWIVSGQNIPEQKVSIKLPDAIEVDEEKALGVFWNVKEDNFYVKPGINNKERDLISKEMKLVLTLRISLSIHAKM